MSVSWSTFSVASGAAGNLMFLRGVFLAGISIFFHLKSAQIWAFEKQSGKSKLQTDFGLGLTRRTTARNSGLKSSIVPKQIFLSKMWKRQHMRFRVQMKAAAPRSLRTKGKSGLTPVSQATHFAAKLSPSRDLAPKFGTSEEEARLTARRSLLPDSRDRAWRRLWNYFLNPQSDHFRSFSSFSFFALARFQLIVYFWSGFKSSEREIRWFFW